MLPSVKKLLFLKNYEKSILKSVKQYNEHTFCE